MTKTHSLDVVQRWMQAVITNPDGIEDGVTSAESQTEIPIQLSEIESLVLPSKRCSSVQRLSVYGNAYFARLIECLAGEFPALSHALGEELFSDFAITYLQDYPSKSYTLGNLANHFVDFLVAARPPREPNEEPGWPDFLIDLARIESIYSKVFDGPGEEGTELLTAADLQQVPADRSGQIRIQFAESFQLQQFEFPVHEYVTAVRKEEAPEPPEPVETLLAISRRDFVVRRQELSPLQFAILKELSSGATLEQALEAGVAETDADVSQLAEHLQSWFSNWTASGWFRAIQLD